ncbi:MAG: pyridoxal kinase [Acidocella sp.]|nr:pyridoxal kinase [Acidocella sp.]
MGIISIQSQVVAGYVGNSAAAFALQRLGTEVFAIPTVLLSHHPGHGGAGGEAVPPRILARILEGLQARGCYSRCEAILSGYLGSAENADIVREVIDRVHAARPDFTYLCDPVLGDDGRTYVNDSVVAAVQGLVRLADIVTPNAYELSLLSGRNFANRCQALQAMRVVQASGPKIVFLTSFCGNDTPKNTIDMLIIDGELAWRLTIPKFEREFSGAGDLLAASFLYFWLPDHDTRLALGAACSALHEVLLETVAQDSDELSLISAQNRMAAPACNFTAEIIV